MPKINVYLPDDLAGSVREAQLPVSAICQSALEKAVRELMALREEAASPGPRGTPVSRARGAFARYTVRGRRAIDLAQAAANDFGHNYIGTEHLLLGIVAEGDNVGLEVLECLEVEPADVESELRAAVGPPSKRSKASRASGMPFTPRAKAALELASKESSKLGHNYVGCEHLVLGLVTESDGIAGKVLRRMSVEPRSARRAVVHLLPGSVHRGHLDDGATEPAPELLEQIMRRLDAIESRLAG